eukprot:TRINITY_DN23664_c0_g1_i1.p1 TRINITY_DN23664_c0_g1~~TRINITY_DN23664_c0_g1_i1.p1  ORF type:complete len:299 (+),score=87.55 TRINITY_DN23664_c0_g1_i1:91-987(+)
MGQQTSRDPAVVNEGKGKVALSLAHQGFKTFPVERVQTTNICQQVTKIDIGHNELDSVDFIRLFPVLEDLYMDGNKITHMTKFPFHAKLKSLSLNANQIGRDGAGGTMCVDKIAKAFPSLTFLSLIHNPGCPSYFSGSSQTETEAFRSYCIAKIPTLEFLDSTPVTEDEREEAEEDMEDFTTSARHLKRKESTRREAKEDAKKEEKIRKEQRKEEKAAERLEREKEKQEAKRRLEDLIDKEDPDRKVTYCNRCMAKQVIEVTHEGSRQHCPKCLQPFIVSIVRPSAPPTPPLIPPQPA